MAKSRNISTQEQHTVQACTIWEEQLMMLIIRNFIVAITLTETILNTRRRSRYVRGRHLTDTFRSCYFIKFIITFSSQDSFAIMLFGSHIIIQPHSLNSISNGSIVHAVISHMHCCNPSDQAAVTVVQFSFIFFNHSPFVHLSNVYPRL